MVVAGYPACGHPTPQFLTDRERAGEVLLRSQGLLQGHARGEGGTVVGIRRKALGIVAVDIIRGGFTVDEDRTVQQLQQKRAVVGYPGQGRTLQRRAQTQASGFPGFTPGNDLGHHGIVERGYGITGLNARIYPHILALGHGKQAYRPGTGQKAGSGILGTQSHLDGMAKEVDILLLGRQGLSLGDPNLPLHQIEPGDTLGHWMLNLQPGVHLQKVKFATGVQQKLHRAGADIVHRPGRLHRGLTHGLPQLRRHHRTGGLLHHLLMATLQRAISLAQMNDVAVGVGENLHLDVTGALHQTFQNKIAITKGSLGLSTGQSNGLL